MEPLSCCSEFSTSDIQQFEHQLVAVLGATEFDVSDRADLKLCSNFVRLHDLALGFLRFGTSARVGFATHDAAALGVTLRGRGATASGTQTALAAVGRPTLASSGQPAEFRYGASLEKLFVRFRPEALERKLAALLGAPINRRLKFELNDFTSPEMLSGLLGLVDMLVHQVERRSLLSPVALRELEEAVTVQLLFTGRHALSGQLQRKPSETSANPVRWAEQFIEANWRHPITMEALTEVTGVSARTLFRSFIKVRGYSPTVFARKIRLERARELLSQPNAAASVTGVALACGFSNLGRFAHDYGSMFGELPSETLNRSHTLLPDRAAAKAG